MPREIHLDAILLSMLTRTYRLETLTSHGIWKGTGRRGIIWCGVDCSKLQARDSVHSVHLIAAEIRSDMLTLDSTRFGTWCWVLNLAVLPSEERVQRSHP